MLNFEAVPGQVLKRRKDVFVWHMGIYTGRGTVIDTVPTNGTSERSLADFADGKEVLDGGYPGNLQNWLVVENAKRMIGEAYSFARSNCEHLVSQAHGLKKSSPQLQILAAFGVITLIAFAMAQTKKP
ncbi:MAG: hypothetical protein COB46_06970 [Rhodospirillaceae bacterium]|nr:MAG: hypothetical protein COB46_06970 [Rhodospirillaceae bacterium]